MWRRAWVEGAYIVVHCPVDELQRHHLPDLKQDVAETNRTYRDLLQQARMREARAQQLAEEERRKTEQELDSLNFND